MYGVVRSNPPDTVPVVYASFESLDSVLGEGKEDALWTVVVPLPAPQGRQTRMYCSAERAVNVHASSERGGRGEERKNQGGGGGKSDASAQQSAATADVDTLVAVARAHVLQVLASYITTVDPRFEIAGCVHEKWAGALEDAWGLRDVEAEVKGGDAGREEEQKEHTAAQPAAERARGHRRPRCWVLLAPDEEMGVAVEWAEEGVVRVGGEEYEVDVGREGDVQSVSQGLRPARTSAPSQSLYSLHCTNGPRPCPR
jgi:hypothetical protein